MAFKLSSKRAQVVISPEATPGTAETLSNADIFVEVESPRIEPGQEFAESDLALTDLSPQTSFVGKFPVTIRFTTYFRGSGTANTAPIWGDLFKMAGLSETPGASEVVYQESTPNPNPSYTVGLLLLPDRETGGNDTGVFWQAKGCHVAVMEMSVTAGQQVRISWEIRGAFVSATNVDAFTGVSVDATVPPVALGTAFTIGSYTPQFNTFTLRFENSLGICEDQSEATGIERFTIAGRRQFTITLDPYITSVSTYNALALLAAGTEQALSFVVGTTAGNILTVTAGKVQLQNVGQGDRTDLMVNNLTARCNRTSGDDAVIFETS